MNTQCPRCLSSTFRRIGNACELCIGRDVHQRQGSQIHDGRPYQFFRIHISEEQYPEESEVGNQPRTTMSLQPTQQGLQLFSKNNG